MNYTEVTIELTPFVEEGADFVVALLEGLPYESFSYEEPFVKCYIPSSKYSFEELIEGLSPLEESQFRVEVSAKEIESVNWNHEWESNFDPIVIDDRCTVKASFHKNLPPTEYSITIDPKMAFGTGHHNTTALMIGEILNQDLVGKRVLDMGCGTGILAILATQKGAMSPVVAIDFDPDATASTIENCQVNGCSDKIRVITGDASAIEGEFDIILANINRNIIIEDIARYTEALSSKGLMILSGFFSQDSDLIVEKGSGLGLQEVKRDNKEQWALLLLQKK